MRYFLFVLLFVFSTQGFSDKEWYYVGEAEDGLTQLYFNKNKLAKRDGKLFVWMMVSEKVRRSYGKSAKELILTDCKIPYSYEQLSLTFFSF